MHFPTVSGVTLDLNDYEFTVTSQGCVSNATSTSVRLSGSCKYLEYDYIDSFQR